MRYGQRTFEFDGAFIELRSIPIASPATSTDYVFAFSESFLFWIILLT